MKRHKLMVTAQVPGFQAKQYFENHWARKRGRNAFQRAHRSYVAPVIKYDGLDSGRVRAQNPSRLRAYAAALIAALLAPFQRLRHNRKG